MSNPWTAQARRVVVQAFAEDPLEAIETSMQIEDFALPKPEELKTTDVIVELRAAAVGWVDLLMTSGLYQHMPKPPYCPGLEYCGVVAWTGAEVPDDQIKCGDRVLVDAFLSGPRSLGDYQAYGGFATHAVAPMKAIRSIPGDLSFAEACHFLGSYETAYHCLVTRGKLQPHETILIHGASGATGLAAVHVAKCIGATVIATGRNPKKLEVVKAQGADHVVNLRAEEGKGVRRFREDVKALTEEQGVDVVYDSVGGDISLESLRCVRFGARFLIVGWAATPFVADSKGKRGAPRANQLPTNLIMMKGLDVLGCPAVISAHRDPSLRVERLGVLTSWVEQGLLRPYTSDTFAFAEFQDALRAKWKSRSVGGCALLIS